MPPSATASVPAVKADPNVFFATFLAGCVASNVPKGTNGETWASQAKDAWFVFRGLIDFVASGEDVKMFEERAAAERRIRQKQEETERKDAEAEAAARAKAEAAHGAK